MNRYNFGFVGANGDEKQKCRKEVYEDKADRIIYKKKVKKINKGIMHYWYAVEHIF